MNETKKGKHFFFVPKRLLDKKSGQSIYVFYRLFRSPSLLDDVFLIIEDLGKRECFTFLQLTTNISLNCHVFTDVSPSS